MQEPVLILNTDKKIKAANLCDRLLWDSINFNFESMGDLFCVYVAKIDVKRALGGDF